MLWRALGVGLLTLGALATMLGAVRAPLFDLDRFGVPKELALHGAALAAGAVLLLGRRRLELGVVEVGFLVFAGWTLLSAVFATNHWLALRATALTTSGVVVFLAARAFTAGSDPARRALVAGVLAAVVAAVATGLAQAYGWDAPVLARTRAPGGLLGNRNFLAHLAVIALPLALWLAQGARGRAGVLAPAVAAAALAAAVVLSRSRAAWVGAGVVLLVAVLGAVVARLRRAGGDQPGAAPLIGGAMAVGALAALLVPNQLDWTSPTPYRDSLRDVLNYREGSGRGRLIQYRNSLRLVAADPVFGTGPGNWVVKYPLVTTPGDPSYNAVDPMPTNPWPSSDWVALVAERGPAGLALGVGVLLAILGIGLRRAFEPDPARRLRAVAALGVAGAAAVIGLFDAVLLLAPPTFAVMASLGALLPETRALAAVEPRAGRARWPAAALLALTLLALARGGAQLASMVTAGSGMPRARLAAGLRYDPASYRLLVLLALRSPCPEAGAHARRAAALLPHHPAPRRLAARCQGRGPAGR